MEIRQTHLLAEYQETMGEKMKRRQNYDNIKILWETEKKKREDEIESICIVFLFFFFKFPFSILNLIYFLSKI